MTATIRAATRDDLPAIVRAAYSPFIARIGRAPGPLLADHGARIAAGRVRVAVRDGAVVGVLVLVSRDDAVPLDHVAVAPWAQGSGVGRLLLAFAEAAARQANAPAIVLCTNEAMTETRAPYARLDDIETHRAEKRGLRRVTIRRRLRAPGPSARR